MAQRIVITDIVWDAEPEARKDLPSEVRIQNPPQELIDDVDGYGDGLANYLSDNYEFCVCNFSAAIE